ncbi:hypothetical protein K1T71_005632 [Dendrolimus kikuchii]|uniref:Uncharacterized protein n=1 Tax=Dendrolimus kikuchii TaxID=765133 RepID=A0ACC1D5Q1_9NEOP|nr:hypothetical protein K1T71_005632 [Dendrolimus kikuchii]
MKKHSEKLSLDVSALTPSCAKAPKLYGLPKIHKNNIPLRPYHVKDSFDFISAIENLTLAEDEVLVSFDVQSLFTSLPVEDCIEIVKRKLIDNNMPEEYADLLKHCLTSGYFVWDYGFYDQINGVAMGSPVSPVVADIFMEDFEQKALDTAPAKPKMYKRYVDDTFAVLPNDKVSAFLDHLNSISSNIKFTMELEANNKLAFLDVLILRNPDNTLGHTVYRKPTHTDKYLNGKLLGAKNLSQKAQLAVHNAVLVPTLTYGSESWRLKYAALGTGYIFEPFGVETLGPWGPSAHKLFQKIKKRLVDKT